jgi:alpha-ketoglutarate-dependent taurine dioxygenase
MFSRGLIRRHYVTRIVQHAANSPFKMLTDGVQLGTAGSFHYTWLRDHCACPQCIHPDHRQKLHSATQVVQSSTPSLVELYADKIRVTFSGTSPHISEFTADWLTRASNLHTYYQNDVVGAKTSWDKQMLEGEDLFVEYDDYMQSPASQLHILRLLSRYGLAFLRKVPTNDTQVEQVATRIGPIYDTFYGRSWNVKSVPHAKNIAYTSVELGLHMDLLYMEAPPGVQLLHCLANQVTGGTSTFVDTRRVIEQLKQEDVQLYGVLCRVPVTYHYQNDGHSLFQCRPTITPKEHRDYDMYYAPPFQGVHNIPYADQALFYQASSKLDALINRPDFVHEHTLRPGECVLFANRRVLHGRRAFDPTQGLRHLKGTYLSMDAVQDLHRTLEM